MQPKTSSDMQQFLIESVKTLVTRPLGLVAIVVMTYLLQGCGNQRLAAVEERNAQGSSEVESSDKGYSAVDEKVRHYQVKAGDTLYSIAFRFNLDHQTLAKANDIGSNFLIKPGQLLDIEKARNYSETSQQTASNTVAIARPTGGQEISRQPVTVARKPITQKPSNTKPANQKPVTRKPTTIKKPVVTRVNKPASNANQNKPAKPQPTKPQPALKDPNAPVKYWIWPNMGKVTRSFASSGKGIDIAGNIGDAVRASAAGRVVYAGRGLRGYGNLIIIKHNNSFISAYAHNRRLLVKENEIIKAGQKIAEIGNSDTDLPKLHFEIRYKGKPTDPLRYLPKR